MGVYVCGYVSGLDGKRRSGTVLHPIGDEEGVGLRGVCMLMSMFRIFVSEKSQFLGSLFALSQSAKPHIPSQHSPSDSHWPSAKKAPFQNDLKEA